MPMSKYIIRSDADTIDDELLKAAVSYLNAVRGRTSTEMKLKRASVVWKLWGLRMNQGERDLPHPRSFISKTQWDNTDLVTEDQMIIICGEIAKILKLKHKMDFNRRD